MSKFKPSIPKPGSLTWGFRLGDVVRDTISGIEGVAIARTYHITGCDRFMIELPAKDGQKPEHYGVEGERLELVKEHPERHTDEIPDFEVALGDIVRDYSTGLEGRVSMIFMPLHGAARVTVEPGYDKKQNKMPDGWMVDVPFVEVVTPFETAKEKAKKPDEEPKTTGKRGCSRMGRERAPRDRMTGL